MSWEQKDQERRRQINRLTGTASRIALAFIGLSYAAVIGLIVLQCSCRLT